LQQHHNKFPKLLFIHLMHNRIILLFLLIGALSACKRDKASNAVNPSPLLYELIYKRSGNEFPASALVVDDSVYATASFSDAAFAKTDIALCKFPSSGEGMISKQIGLSATTNTSGRIVYLADKRFMILGATGNVSTNGMVLFTDRNGTFQSGYNFDNGGDESFADGIQMSDGSFLLAGTSNGAGHGLRDMFLVKMSVMGSLVWKKLLGTTGNDGATQLLKTSDGFLLYGYSDGVGAGDRDLLLIKLNANGDSLWSRTFGGSGYEQSGGMVATTDGNYLLCGHSTSFGDPMHDAYLVKINPNGDEIWHKTYGGGDHDGADGIVKLSNGNFAMIGYSRIVGLTDDELYYVEVLPDGTLKRELRYGYASNERGAAIAEVSNGILLIGYTAPLSNQNSELYVVKIVK